MNKQEQRHPLDELKSHPLIVLLCRSLLLGILVISGMLRTAITQDKRWVCTLGGHAVGGSTAINRMQALPCSGGPCSGGELLSNTSTKTIEADGPRLYKLEYHGPISLFTGIPSGTDFRMCPLSWQTLDRNPATKAIAVCDGELYQPTLPHMLARQADRQQGGGGCRKVTEVPCPGEVEQGTEIELFPEMFLVNRGDCAPFVVAFDQNGTVIRESHLKIPPGESRTYVPPNGSVRVEFACSLSCEGTGRLEHPFLCA
jgi:hypothetical protein